MTDIVMRVDHVFPAGREAPHAFAFSVWMAAVVTARRGGRNSDHLAECFDFLRDVVRTIARPTDPLPEGYDWTPAGAITTANALLEYDA